MKTPKHILVLRLSALGDVAMTVPVLRVVSQTYPGIRFTVVSRPVFKPLFDDIPNLTFEEADVYGKHKGPGLLRLANKVRRSGIDAVADLHNVIRSKVITNYLMTRGIKTATIDKGRKEKKALTRKKNKEFKVLKTTHQRYADVFNRLGLPIELSQHRFPERRPLSPRLLSLIGQDPKKCIGIAPFAAYQSKTYPFEAMKEVIKALDAGSKYRIFLFGGGDHEIDILREAELEFNSATNIAGTLTFEEELSLISNLDLMVSMDSGNGHLAAMLGIPVVTIWGVTHPHAGFTPFAQPAENSLLPDREAFPMIPTSVYGNKYPKGYDTAIASISPEGVTEKILNLI